MNHIQAKIQHIAELEKRIAAADEIIQDFKIYLQSPKFTVNPGEDYININDVDRWIAQIRHALHQE